jgi:hypothetical protein
MWYSLMAVVSVVRGVRRGRRNMPRVADDAPFDGARATEREAR